MLSLMKLITCLTWVLLSIFEISYPNSPKSVSRFSFPQQCLLAFALLLQNFVAIHLWLKFVLEKPQKMLTQILFASGTNDQKFDELNKMLSTPEFEKVLIFAETKKKCRTTFN